MRDEASVAKPSASVCVTFRNKRNGMLHNKKENCICGEPNFQKIAMDEAETVEESHPT